MAARGAQGRSLEVLLLGAPGSGKTLLVRRIKALCNIRSSLGAPAGSALVGGRWAADRAEALGYVCVCLCMLCRVPDEIADTMQTNGVELDEITYGKSTLKIREVGGAFVEVRASCAV